MLGVVKGGYTSPSLQTTSEITPLWLLSWKSRALGCFHEYMEILYKLNGLNAVTSHTVRIWAYTNTTHLLLVQAAVGKATCPLLKWQSPLSSQSHPSMEEDAFPTSKKKSILGPNNLNKFSYESVTTWLSKRAKSDPSPKCIEARELLKLCLFYQSAKTHLHKPEGQKKFVKTLSLKGTKDFLFLPISPKATSPLKLLETLLL